METTNAFSPWKFILYLGTLILILCKYIYLILVDFHVLRIFTGYPVYDALLGITFGIVTYLVAPSLYPHATKSMRVVAMMVLVFSALYLLSVLFK